MPVKKTDKQQWLRAGLALLDGAGVEGYEQQDGQGSIEVTATGRYLPEVGLTEICALAALMNNLTTLSKGSFYNHFHDGLTEFYKAVIAAWREDRDQALERSQVTVIENPRDRLRVLRSCAEQTAVRDDAMRRWAAAAEAGEKGAAEAASALTASNEAVLPILTAALSEVGLPSGRRGRDGMAQTHAKVIAAEFGCGRGPMTIQPGDANGFANLMQGLDDMVAGERQRKTGDRRLDVSTVETAGGKMTVFVITPESADPEEVRAAVQDLADRVAASEADSGSGRKGRKSSSNSA